MRLNRIITYVALLLLSVHCLAADAPLTLEVLPDHPDALYKVNEPVTFRITLRDDERAVPGKTLEYKITKDGTGDLGSGSIESGKEPVTVKASLDEPGFIRCDVKCKPEPTTRNVVATGGAGISPEQIKPSMPVPDDFDAFWQKQKDRLSADPAKAVLTKVASSDPSIEAFDVQINCPGGAPVSGYVAKPKDAKPKSLPAILYPHSAGVRDSDLPHAIRGAKMGLIALDFNAHGLPNAKGDQYYNDLANTGALKGYAGKDIDDREKIYFLGMYLRVLRALDYLTQQPEWDGKILIVEGSSQGGGQALVAAGLDPRVTLCLASVPAMCDDTAPVVQRTAGWPRMLQAGAGGKFDPRVVEALRYIDAMNCASRIKCPTTISVGFIDKTCAPSSVYAAYNNIPGSNKTIINRPQMGHAFPPDLIAHYDDLIRQHVAEMRKN